MKQDTCRNCALADAEENRSIATRTIIDTSRVFVSIFYTIDIKVEKTLMLYPGIKSKLQADISLLFTGQEDCVSLLLG